MKAYKRFWSDGLKFDAAWPGWDGVFVLESSLRNTLGASVCDALNWLGRDALSGNTTAWR